MAKFLSNIIGNKNKVNISRPGAASEKEAASAANNTNEPLDTYHHYNMTRFGRKLSMTKSGRLKEQRDKNKGRSASSISDYFVDGAMSPPPPPSSSLMVDELSGKNKCDDISHYDDFGNANGDDDDGVFLDADAIVTEMHQIAKREKALK